MSKSVWLIGSGLFYKYCNGGGKSGRGETGVPTTARLGVLQETVSKPSDHVFECYL